MPFLVTHPRTKSSLAASARRSAWVTREFWGALFLRKAHPRVVLISVPLRKAHPRVVLISVPLRKAHPHVVLISVPLRKAHPRVVLISVPLSELYDVRF